VSNSFFTVTLDEAKGGTVTEFRSAATGRDYGAEGFGVNYGTFGESDPAKPCSNTVTFIKESKTRQQSRPGKVTLVAKGPLVATATVEWEDRNISVTQTYEFSAYQSHFLLRQAARPAPTLQAQEIVALDARFKPNALCKTYPNFVGIAPKPNEASPHYGWRYGNWIPDYLTIMEQTGFQESISLIPVRCVGLDQVRQGFWPPERPKPGPKTFAEIEFIAHVVNPIELDVYVLLHPGYQVVAKQFREFVMENPLLVLPATSPKWRPSKIGQLPAPKADWFDVFWHYRVPVGDSSPSGLPLLQAKVNLQELVPGKAIDENSLRLVRHDDVSKTWQLLPFSFDKTDGVLSWRLPPAPLAKSVAHTFLYFDSESNGAKPPVAQKHMGQLAIKKGSRPRTPDEWAFENAQLLERGGPEGQYAVRLLCPAKAYYSLASNHAILALPRTRYRVSFLARAIKAPVTLHTNFYQGKDYDFAHGSASVPATEEWKRYETVIETRDFPESVHPVFRLWVTEKDKEVLLSGISVEPLDALGPSPVEVELGKVESLH
jgi:hypothetical protein